MDTDKGHFSAAAPKLYMKSLEQGDTIKLYKRGLYSALYE